MKPELIAAKFAAIGARAIVKTDRTPRETWDTSPFTLDIQRDQNGERFELLLRSDVAVDFAAIDVQPAARHLLLLAKGHNRGRDGKIRPFAERLLCGHDERHWFVAAARAGSTVAEAKEALKPALVREAQVRQRLKTKARHTRRNAAFVRQGEWFFIPCPDLLVDERLVLRNEPIRRGRGKPHRVQFLYREGGTSVRVCPRYPTGVTDDQYRHLVTRDPDAAKLPWQWMQRDPVAFAKGKVRHSDHKTINLPCWHRIVVSAEAQSRNVPFLD